ncbi:MAG: HAD-IIB family hydrolase [Proteobacteria bacterium]|nr:HAD-IIB family hydrolase [Pseudomonadota bacterium]
MQPLSTMPAAVARQIETLFTDIDDTLTSAGRVPAAAYEALWRAWDAGLEVVLVTGRPAGWCDHLARQWPVRAVIGENGALAFALIDGQLLRLFAPRPADADARLAAIRAQVLAEVPGCRVAADQHYRYCDLAIDIAEEVAPLPDAAVDRIVAIFTAHGAVAKVSSIHVNGWYGAHDKLSMCQRWSHELRGRALDPRRATFIGDSPNDAPMFAAFPHACGVANLQRLAPRITPLPRYLTSAAGGEGFAELVTHLLAARR